MTQAPQPPQTAQTPAGMKPHRGTMELVFGILGLVCCFIFGIVAWVMSSKDLQEMAAGRMDPSGMGLAKAGKILGIISVCLAIVGIVVQIIVLATGGSLYFSAGR